jgi:hypothetical protein
MSKDKDTPPGPQPFLDTLKVIKALNRSPIWREQQAAFAKLRERWKALLELSPDLAEALRQMKEGAARAARLDAEALHQAKEESAGPSPEPAPAPPTEEPVVSEEPATAIQRPATESPVRSEVAPIKRKRPKQWAAEWMQNNSRRKGEGPGEYAQRMCDDMATAPDVTEAWPFENCRRELYREPKEVDFEPDPGSVQAFPKHH